MNTNLVGADLSVRPPILRSGLEFNPNTPSSLRVAEAADRKEEREDLTTEEEDDNEKKKRMK